MKFTPKLLLVSMVAVGALASAPATFAAGTTTPGASSQVAQMEAIMNRDQDGVKKVTSELSQDWFQKIRVSGIANIDAGYATRNYEKTNKANDEIGSESNSQLYINNANLFIDAPVTDWSNLHVNLGYAQDRSNTSAVPNEVPYGTEGLLGVEEAYASIRNFNQTPFYLTVGRQFINFGSSYDHHPMFDSMTQLLSQTLKTAATVGVVTCEGVYGSVYGFNGPRRDSADGVSRLNDYGAQVGFAGSQSGINYNVQASWMKDASAVGYVEQKMRNAGDAFVEHDAYNNSTHAWTLGGSVGTGPFSGRVDYVRFDRFAGGATPDIAYKGRAAKPWALDLDLGYQFKTMDHASSVDAIYNMTREASGNATNNRYGLYLPKTRYGAMYNVNLLENVDMGLGLVHDKDYSVAEGGVGRNVTAGTVRLSLQFA